MSDFKSITQRFFFAGISVFPPDAQPPGKMPYALNIRSYSEGIIRPREGVTARINASLGAAVHTLARLNDPTPFNGGVPVIRVIGAGNAVFVGDPSGMVYGSIDSGYTADVPMTTFTAQPPRSPRPWMYVASADRYRKFLSDGGAVPVGLAQPSAPDSAPSAAVNQLQTASVDPIDDGMWVAAGPDTGDPVRSNRITTVIGQIVYDNGTPGYASIVPASTRNITVGTNITVGGSEQTVVTEVTIPVANTTIDAIIYDAGGTGLCTIQPHGSLGVGQLDAPSIAAYRRRAIQQQLQPGARTPHPGAVFSGGHPAPADDGIVGSPIPTDGGTRRIRQVDFPVNALIVLGGAETVRILSVALGPDGVQSFRCSTTGSFGASDTIAGLFGFRVYLNGAFGPGASITRSALNNEIIYPEPAEGEKARVTAGIQTALPVNFAQFANGTAVLPQDDLHIAIRVTRLSEVVSVRIYLDNDATSNDFLQNYYFYEWRASDIITAIQTTNAENVTPLVDARRTVVANQQLEPQGYLQRRGIIGPPKTFAERHGVPTPSPAPVSMSAVATQLALGNNQWIDLVVKIGQLIQTGTDPGRTLADVKAIEILVALEAPQADVIPDPLQVFYSDVQVYGGGGPDVGDVGDPYVWAYRYRSSLTGAVSNPSPAIRGGSIPQRQNVSLMATPSGDGQVDLIDWFRLGGALTQFTYVGSGPNDANPYEDRYEDSKIDGGEVLAYDNFQPWPLQDQPYSGTADVAGTAIRRTGGPSYNGTWAPGSFITVNGRTTTLYASPASGDLLHVTDSVGDGSNVLVTMLGPTLMGQPLGRAWGDFHGIYFACGDSINPGTLYWSHGNNPEATSDAFSLILTSPSEPLQNGGIYNTFPFVASSEEVYAIRLTSDPDNPIQAERTPCGRGFWTPWAWCIGPEGIYFLAADGIYLTAGGSAAQSISTPDLRAIFPKDGVPGTAVNGIPPVNMTQTTSLRLSYIAGFLYFDYSTGDGTVFYTLVYDTLGQRWMLDTSALTGFKLRLEEPGAGVYDQIIGGQDGKIYQYDADVLSDAGAAIAWEVDPALVDGGDPRLVKQFGDVLVSANPQGSTGIAVQVLANDGTVTYPPVTVGAGVVTRQPFIIAPNAGDGVLARNLGIAIRGTLTGAALARPLLYLWEPSFVPKADDISSRATDWDDLGYVGAKFIQGVIIRANTYGVDKDVRVERATADGAETMLTLRLNHDGEAQIAYPLSAAGWDPFIGELVRLSGADDATWQLLGYRFVFEPAPELATQWETQFTSAEWPGYGHLRDMVIAHETTTPLTLVLSYDDRDQVYTLPASGGVYRRDYLVLCPGKGKSVRFKWTTSEPGRLYKRDIVVRAAGWGDASGYRPLSPFGGPSRLDGAAI